MHETPQTSQVPRFVLYFGHVIVVSAVCWLLLGRGWETLGRENLMGQERAWMLAAFAIVYLLRLAWTTFVFLKRPLPWSEVAAVLPWLAALHLTFAWAATRIDRPLGWPFGIALVLYLAGSWLNTMSEYQRMQWKKSHPGELFTEGYFRHSRHVNYFGDSLLFTGYALASGAWWTLLLPAIMTASFLFGHIPRLEKHLAGKYGDRFKIWAERTPRFIPYIY